MVSVVLNVGLGLVLLVLWGYVMALVLRLSSSGYGGKYTTVFPSLFGGFAVLLAYQTVELGFDVLVSGVPGEPLFFGLQTLQLLAGVLLVRAVYQLYQVEYATTGFFGDDREGEA